MCSLMEHSDRSYRELMAERETAEQSAEPVFAQTARDHGIIWPPAHTTAVQEFGPVVPGDYQPHGHVG